MHFKDFGVIFKNTGESIEKVTLRGMNIELLASYDGTEIIKIHLLTGMRWGIGPSDGWDALEYIHILEGKLQIHTGPNKIVASTGDYLKMIPIKNVCLFQAIEDTMLLYITSKPVFHNFSNELENYKQIANSVEEKDGYTFGHCNRIMNISMMLGEKLNLSSQELYQLNIGAFLHDVGKIKIPDSILLKPGKLTDEEWEQIKMHPIYGHNFLVESGYPFLINAAKIVEQHHERYDGSGYPYGLKGDEILIGSAIVAVVDSYDAMTSDRIYRKALSKEQAITELRNGSGSLYHPDVVQAFISIKDKIFNYKKERNQ
ncbi:HD-GYP domain-containing protein [Caldibacillus lycopersici]|uniref:HD-GYP domain-containing protein n=1 Tax=Perspicuibacillus lycopersici TaxID=1325689 RepID=A0AAE3LNU8_9BACI|nr:HD-GYP domain-containing protein [Perspicuibacillus lycopersici]MCU9615130.1 HD-GYP domain-containing protein [Perspicuibacillus lycopersici]